MYTPFDELLEEVGRVADVPSLESIRKSVIRNLVQVYRKIGRGAWQPATQVYVLNESGQLTLPEFLIELEAVLPGELDNIRLFDQIRGLPELSATGDLRRKFPLVPRYAKSGDKLWFERPVTGSLTVLYWRIPVDDRGIPQVDDRLFKAASLYCQAEEARISLHKKNKQSYSGVPYQVDRQEANQAIDAARAAFNKLAKTDWLQLYADLVRQQ